MNLRKIISFVLVVLFVLSVVPFTAFAVGTEGLMFGYNSVLGGAVIVNYEGSEENVVIPDTDNSGNTVIGIAYGAFNDNVTVKSITMPNTITYLEERAIVGCSSLESVVLSENLESIGAYNFWGSGSLKSIFLPATLVELGDCAFAGTTSLETIEVDGKNARFKSENGCLIETDMENRTVTVRAVVTAESIVIPDSVTDIGEYAFYGKDTVAAVTFPVSPITIGRYAFKDCTSLTSVSAAASVCSYAFWSCKALKEVTLKDGAEFVESEAFVGCFALETVNIPATVSDIETSAFFNCTKINELYVAENSAYYKESAGNLVELATGKLIARKPNSSVNSDVKIIGVYSFYGHSDTHISLPDSVTAIEDNAFVSMSSLKAVSMVKVETIGNRAFYMCEDLETVVLGNALEVIGDEAFANCPFVKSYTLPDTVTTIGDKAFFYNSMALGDIYIPSSVVNMGADVFKGCSRMTDIYCGAEEKPETWEAEWLGDCPAEVHWGIENPATDGFAFELNQEGTEYTIISYTGDAEEVTIPLWYNGKPVTAIGDCAFMFNDTMRTVDFGSVLTSIGDTAFMQCTALAAVSIPANVTHLGNNPFAYCPAITSMEVALENQVYHSYKNNIIHTDDKILVSGIGGVIASDGSVTEIADYAYSGSSLSGINIPNTVTYVGNYAFADCKSLTLVSYSNPDTEIGVHLYEGCELLPSAFLPSNITKVPMYTFFNCYSITVCNLPSKVDEIGEGAFYGCTSFTGGFLYNIPLTTIGDYAFKGCTAMTKFVVDVNITSIGKGAFAYTSLNRIDNYENENFYIDGNCLIDANTQTIVAAMTELTDISDPFRVRGINASVFEGKGMFDYTITEYVKSIGEYAFQNCVNLTSIVIPESVTEMGTWVFNECGGMTDIYVATSEKPSGWDDEWLGNCKATVHWGYSAALAEAVTLIDELKSLNSADYGETEWAAIQAALAELEEVDLEELTDDELSEIVQKLTYVKINNPKNCEYGDLDGDAKISSSDYLFTKRACFGSFKLNAEQTARADVNNDGKVDSADYVSIKRIAFGTFKFS